MLGFYRELNSLGYRAADLITPCNQYNRRWEERGGADAERIRMVYNGVDPHAFPHAGPEPDVPTHTWCGRVDPIKDLETLLRAYGMVRAEMPGTRLRLFGPVPPGGQAYRTRLEKLAAELGVTDGLTFEGRISEVWRAYAAGHVVMLSSISEGFPFSIIEAMSCGRTTVSTDVGGVREAVGDTGLVVPPREPLVTFEGAWGTYRTSPFPPWTGTGARLCHLVYGVPAGVDQTPAVRERGAALHCAVPGMGDHPWGTLPHTLEPAR